MIKTLNVRTNTSDEMINITREVQEVVSQSNVKNGMCIIYVPHTTSGITINEGADPDVKSDILTAFKSLNFEKLPFKHSEGNSPSHCKASIMGSSVTLIIENSQLVLGTWQAIFFCEFDGPRHRKVIVKIIH